MEEMNEGQVSAVQAESAGKEMKKTYSRIGFALFALIGITTVIQIIMQIPLLTNPELMETIYLWIATFVPIYVIAFPITVLILRKMPKKAPEEHPLGIKGFLAAFAVSILSMFVGNIIGSGLSALLSSNTAQNPLSPFLSETSIVSVLVTVILAPIVEETIFRKMLIDRVACYGGGLAVLMSGLLFGLFHENLFQFFYAFAIGVVLAYVYLKTGKIIYTIALHMIINLFGGVFASTSARMMQNGQPYGEALFTCYLVALGVLVVGGIIVLIVKRKSFTFAPAERQVEHGFRLAMGNAGIIVYTVFCVAMVVFVLLIGLLAALG